MFDFSKLSDMSRLASEAKQIQEKQDHFQRQQLEWLQKISAQLDEVLVYLRKNN